MSNFKPIRNTYIAKFPRVYIEIYSMSLVKNIIVDDSLVSTLSFTLKEKKKTFTVKDFRFDQSNFIGRFQKCLQSYIYIYTDNFDVLKTM